MPTDKGGTVYEKNRITLLLCKMSLQYVVSITLQLVIAHYNTLIHIQRCLYKEKKLPHSYYQEQLEKKLI